MYVKIYIVKVGYTTQRKKFCSKFLTKQQLFFNSTDLVSLLNMYKLIPMP